MKVVLVAAADEEWGIGLRGGIPWTYRADMARFRRRTMGKAVIVGLRTAESLPNGLPGRRLVVVSRKGLSVPDAIAREAGGGEEVFVAGGSEVYRAALPLADLAEVTRMPGTFGCDAFMPDLKAAGWRIAGRISEEVELEVWRP